MKKGKNAQFEQDLWNKQFCWHPRLWKDFFISGFFFRCLYSSMYTITYTLLHRHQLDTDTIINQDTSEPLFPQVLGLVNSTVIYPINNYSYFHQFAESEYVGKMRLIGKPGLSLCSLADYVDTHDIPDNQYHLILVSCLQQDIVKKSINPQMFEDGFVALLEILRKKTTSQGKIVFVYGDFSLHPTVPHNNYFQDYFAYKIERFLQIMRSHMHDSEHIIEVMNLTETNQETAWSYIHPDNLHFSCEGQGVLYQDLIRGMRGIKVISS